MITLINEDKIMILPLDVCLFYVLLKSHSYVSLQDV